MPMAPETRRHHLTCAGFMLLLIASACAFYPGLGGTFIFDDIPNFEPWIALGDINSQSDILSFISSGAHPPGRPLSLLSFLIDDQSWPADIFSLKRTNLALHLINTCLIFWLCLKLLGRLLPGKDTHTQAMFALLASAIWSLHPLQVSNVSYIIQRMNLLSTTLELAGLLLFFYGREQLDNSPAKALILCSLAIGLFMPLAILAKENGLLLCAFTLLIEVFCFPSPRPKWWRTWKLFFLWAPLIIFLVYCLIKYHGFTTGFEMRNYNAWERLLTQGPVLTDYLRKLLLPSLHSGELFFDNFPISRSLLNPVSSLLCWCLLLAILLLAWALRQRHPVISFGIFFYFCGHLLESTVLPLELYYEHRNYLPQIGLWLALTGLLSTTQRSSLRRLMFAACLTGLALLLILTRTNAAMWSNPALQTVMWHHDNPGSVRNSLSYASLLTKKSYFTEAYNVLINGRKNNPNNFALLISQRYISCYAQDIPTRFDDLPALATKSDYETASITMLQKIYSEYNTRKSEPDKNRKCAIATDEQISEIYKGFLKNKRFFLSRHKLLELLAEMSAARDDPISLKYYDQAFAIAPNPIYPYRQALLLQNHGHPRQALYYTALAKESVTLRYKMLYPSLLSRIETLQQTLEAAPESLAL